MGKNILHVVNIYFVLPYFIGNQFLFFHNKGYKLHVICSPSDNLDEYSNEMKFKYKEIPILRSFSIYQDIISIFQICKYIKNNKISVVVGHTPKGALLSMIAAYIMGVPKRIYFRHGLVYETSRGLKRSILLFLERLSSRLSTKVVCVSPSVYKASLIDKLNKEDKQIILNNGTCNGIDSKKFSKRIANGEIRKNLMLKYNIPENSFVVGYTGRFVKDKGIIELVSAFEIVLKKHKNIYLLLVGMFESRDALPEHTVNVIKSNINIIKPGLIDYNEIEKLYDLMDIFVLPSYREGFPTSVLEASSMELPVITTKVTGCIDSIINNKTGVFVNHDSHSIAQAIEDFFMDKEKTLCFGKEGRKYVLDCFDQTAVWNCIEKMY